MGGARPPVRLPAAGRRVPLPRPRRPFGSLVAADRYAVRRRAAARGHREDHGPGAHGGPRRRAGREPGPEQRAPGHADAQTGRVRGRHHRHRNAPPRRARAELRRPDSRAERGPARLRWPDLPAHRRRAIRDLRRVRRRARRPRRRRAPAGRIVSTAFASIHSGPAPPVPAKPSATGRTLAVTLTAAVVLALAARVVELRPLELARDIGNVGVFLKGYLHPSFANVGEYAWQCLVTVCIALWGTVLSLAVSIPLGLLGARNLAPHPLVYLAARRVMDLLRAVNEFVFALMFVTAVGLGPFAGMLALGIHTGGVLGKLLSEAIESIDPGQVEGVAAVGGGGIGFYLWDTIRSFNDREAATVILLIVAMVMATDMISSRVRRLAI